MEGHEFLNNWKYNLRLFSIGAAMGVANIIPGVSGGTIAVVFGIYEQLMQALGNFLTDKSKRGGYILFLFILFSGALFSIVLFARVLSWAFDNYELMTVYFFMGLIMGSIPVVVRSHHDMKVSPARIAAFIGGAALVVILALFQHGKGTGSEIFNAGNITVFQYLYFLFCGIVASSAMIVPGISGSFILILLGTYRTILDSLSALTSHSFAEGLTIEIRTRLFLLGALGIGIVIGILGFAKFMSWALKRYPAITMYVILGLIIGSFYQIYPGFSFSWRGAGAVLTFVAGLLISLKFGVEDKANLT